MGPLPRYAGGLGRVHLFELEDQAWFPEVFRQAIVGYLRLVADVGGHATELSPILERAVDRSGVTEIVDLGSGGGGPTVAAFAALHERRPELHLTLTDLHPNPDALRGAATAAAEAVTVAEFSVDAADVPATLPGARTLVNVLHHFRSEEARAVLQGAVDARQPIVVIELLRRHPLVFLACLLTFLPMLLAVPFIRPFRWSWLFWTYLVPVIPIAGAWDGTVSCLRIYSEAELRELVDSLDGYDSFEWTFGRVKLPPSPVAGSYLIGTPKPPAG